jgi:hypothetical protein
VKGIRASLQGLLLVACAQVLPAHADIISLGTVGSGEVVRQGTDPASPTDSYSHSLNLQSLQYQFVGFNPMGTALEYRERFGYLLYDVSAVSGTIVDAALTFDLDVTDPVPGELAISTIDPGALDTVTTAPVGPLTRAQFDNLFAALASGVKAVTQTLSAGFASLNFGLGSAATSHLAGAAGLVGFQIAYLADTFQDLSLAIDTAPRLLLTTEEVSPEIATVPLPGTAWLLGPAACWLLRRKRRN